MTTASPAGEPSASGTPEPSSPGPSAPPPDAEVAAAPRHHRRRLLPAPIWHIGKLLVVALVVEYLVLPQIAGTRKALHLLIQVRPGWILLGVVLQVAGLAAYSQLTRVILPKDSDPGLFTVLRIQLTTLSVTHCVPGGTAAGSSLGYRLMTLAGAGKADVGFALALQGIGSAVVLNVIFWIALVVSIPIWGFSPLYLTAAVLGMVLVMLFVGLILLLTKGERWAGRMLERGAGRVPFIDAVALHRFFDQLAARVHELGADRVLMVKATLWAAANWLLDAASLYVFVGAFGHWVNPDGLIVSFGLANLLAAVPITPGGLGVIEATLTSTLVGFDTPRGIAILGVLGYRLINFWLPIPVGGLAYLSLHLDPGHTDRSRHTDMLQAMMPALGTGGGSGGETDPGVAAVPGLAGSGPGASSGSSDGDGAGPGALGGPDRAGGAGTPPAALSPGHRGWLRHRLRLRS